MSDVHRASFQPFVWHDGGITETANTMRIGIRELRNTALYRRRRSGGRRRGLVAHRFARETARIKLVCRIEAARRWLPGNPLLVYWMTREDAFMAARKARR
jgi:hypothetical protein